MKTRRFAVAAVGAAVAALVLSACASTAKTSSAQTTTGTQTSAAAQQSGQKTTLTFWTHTFDGMNNLNKKLIAEFEQENPNITVDYSVIPNDQFFTKMLTAMSSGTGPDVFNMSSTYIESYLQSGNVAPVDPSAFGYKDLDALKAGWQSSAFSLVTSNNQIYGIPDEYDVSALAINKADFEAAGLDPTKPPTTWDEILTDSQKLLKRGTDGQLTHRGFDFYYLPNFYWLDFANLSLQYGGHLLSADGTKSAIDSPQNEKALQWWADWVHKDKLGGPQYGLNDATNPLSDFTSNSVSMFIVYPWAVSAIEASPVWKDTEIVPLPRVDPANPVTHVYGYFWMVNKIGAHQQAAWKFVDFLSSHPEEWLTDVGYVQPKKGWTNSEAAKKFPFLNVWLNSEKIAQPGE